MADNSNTELKPITELPDTVLHQIALSLDMESLASLGQTELRDFINRQYILHELALAHNLPFSENLDQLVNYSRIKPKKLVVICAQKGDIRVVKSILSSERDDYLLSKVLLAAIESGSIEIIEYLKTVDPDAEFYERAMVSNASEGWILKVKFLFDGIKDCVQTLLNAARDGNVQLFKALLFKSGNLGKSITAALEELAESQNLPQEIAELVKERE